MCASQQEGTEVGAGTTALADISFLLIVMTSIIITPIIEVIVFDGLSLQVLSATTAVTTHPIASVRIEPCSLLILRHHCVFIYLTDRPSTGIQTSACSAQLLSPSASGFKCLHFRSSRQSLLPSFSVLSLSSVRLLCFTLHSNSVFWLLMPPHSSSLRLSHRSVHLPTHRREVTLKCHHVHTRCFKGGWRSTLVLTPLRVRVRFPLHRLF